MKYNIYYLFIWFVFINIFVYRCNPIDPADNNIEILVNEDIDEYTNWSGNNTYRIKNKIKIGKNGFLNVENSSKILFDRDESNEGQLIVEGGIHFSGDESSNILVEQNGYNNNLFLIRIHNSLKRNIFLNCSFENCHSAIELFSSEIEIIECDFFKCNMGIFISQCNNVLIKGCNFSSNEKACKIELSNNEEDANGIIIDNNLFNSNATALDIRNKSNVLIKNNDFLECDLGIYLSNGSSAIITKNNFNDNARSLHCFLGVNGEIARNNFDGGTDFIYLNNSSYPNINYNNLLTCKDKKIKNAQGVVTTRQLDATNNWWNTTDSLLISHFIFDMNDDESLPNSGEVKFIPFESSLIKIE